MQRPLQITFRGTEHSDAVEERIRSKAAVLERFYEHITGIHITVEAPHHHHHKGGLYAVRIEISVPDGRLLVNRDHHDDQTHQDVYVAARDAFTAAVRQLEDYVRQRRGEVKHHEGRPGR